MASVLSMNGLKHTFAGCGKHAFADSIILRGMSYGDRLDEALKAAGKTRGDLARVIGITEQAIGQVINGSTDKLKARHSAIAARFLKCDHYWLATGEGAARSASPLSPLAADLARRFDADVPTGVRDRVYAQAMGAIDLATASQQPTVELGAVPTREPGAG